MGVQKRHSIRQPVVIVYLRPKTQPAPSRMTTLAGRPRAARAARAMWGWAKQGAADAASYLPQLSVRHQPAAHAYTLGGWQQRALQDADTSGVAKEGSRAVQRPGLSAEPFSTPSRGSVLQPNTMSRTECIQTLSLNPELLTRNCK